VVRGKNNVRILVFFMAFAKTAIAVNGITTAAVRTVGTNVPVSNYDILDGDKEKGRERVWVTKAQTKKSSPSGLRLPLQSRRDYFASSTPSTSCIPLCFLLLP
jgi:hypothetical protein